MSERMHIAADTADVFALLLADEDLKALETYHPEGLTSKEVVQVFKARSVRLSEATFRKYVQLGLLPRSRRVRRKGRRGGSLGLYPVSVVRRIIEIKQLLAQDFTMDEIRRKFLCARSEIDELEESLARVFSRLENTIKELGRAGEDTELIRRELKNVRSVADRLTGSLRGVERRLESGARDQKVVRKIV